MTMAKIIYTVSGITTNGDVTMYDENFESGYKISEAENISELVDSILGGNASLTN